MNQMCIPQITFEPLNVGLSVLRGQNHTSPFLYCCKSTQIEAEIWHYNVNQLFYVK